jgi:cardiolipin synthase (CMP-forming)
MNVPNLLSIFRLFITFFFIHFTLNGHFRVALLLFITQALSDMLDGFLARKMGAKTNLGSYLDPLADKVMLASSYIVLCVKSVVPLWLVIMVLTRDVVIALGFLILLKKGLQSQPVPIFVSKATTVFQMLTVVYVLWSMDRVFESAFYWVTALLIAVSGMQYIYAGLTVFFKKEVVP